MCVFGILGVGPQNISQELNRSIIARACAYKLSRETLYSCSFVSLGNRIQTSSAVRWKKTTIRMNESEDARRGRYHRHRKAESTLRRGARRAKPTAVSPTDNVVVPLSPPRRRSPAFASSMARRAGTASDAPPSLLFSRSLNSGCTVLAVARTAAAGEWLWRWRRWRRWPGEGESEELTTLKTETQISS